MYRRNVKTARTSFVLALLAVLFLAGAVRAQTTVFTYQGRLTDGGAPANGSYDLQFTLWDSAVGGTQQPQASPAALTKPAVAVTGGVFSVLLDFGVSAFPGADRFLEVGVRPAGSAAAFTILAPRQQISSTPYAIRTLNATAADSLSSACVGCVTDAQINSVAASKLTGTIPAASLPAGGSFIQNTTAVQSNANFNIGGDGTAAGTLSAGVQYNIGGNRVLSAPGTNNLFAGRGAGQANTSGAGNAFVGTGAGQANTTGSNNAFYGFNAGQSNTGFALTNAGSDNSFFGANAGRSIPLSNRNSFFGSNAGRNNGGLENSFFGFNAGAASSSFANQNSFFGVSAGRDNLAPLNSFFGYQAGVLNTSGTFNAFFGEGAGFSNRTGSNNTAIGAGADISASANNQNGSNNTAIGSFARVGGNNTITIPTNATAIGANAFVGQNNSLVLGSINGVNGATADTNVGIGTHTPFGRFQVAINGNPTLSVLNTGHVNLGFTDEVRCGGCSVNALLQVNALTGGDSGLLVSSAGNIGVIASGSKGVSATGVTVGVDGFSTSGTGVGGTSTSGTGVTGQSTSGTGVIGQSERTSGAGVYGKNTAGGYAMFAEGNAGQSRDKGGWAKAMLEVNEAGNIVHCYNAINGTSLSFNHSPNGCGFHVDHLSLGIYRIDFGFQVSDRFVALTNYRSVNDRDSVSVSLDSTNFFSHTVNQSVVITRYIHRDDNTNANFSVIVF